MLRILLLALFTVLVFEATAGVLDFLGSGSSDFTYDDFIRLVNRYNSIDAINHSLPKELQRNITFRLDAHNRLQPGERAIRFTDNGNLMITHTVQFRRPRQRSL